MYLNHTVLTAGAYKQDTVLAAGAYKQSDKFKQPAINKVNNMLREQFLLHAPARLSHQGERVQYSRNTEVCYIDFGSTLK
jgi:hypothetical protein